MKRMMQEHGILLFILTAVLCVFPIQHKIAAAAVLYAFFLLRTRRISLIPLLLFVIVSVPRWNTSQPEEGNYRVVSVHARYSVAEKGNTRILIYHSEPLICDGEYSFDGFCEHVKETRGFYRFSFARYMRQEGVYYSSDSSHFSFVKENASYRRILQKAIQNKQADLQEVLSFTLLNIRPQDSEGGLLYDYGFSITAALSILEQFLAYWIDKRRLRYVSAGCTALFGWLYGFPLVVMQKFVYQLLSLLYQKKQDAVMPSLCAVLCLFPYAAFRGAFWIPAVMRLLTLMKKKDPAERTLCLSLINLLLYSRITPAVTILYPYLRKMAGVLYYVSLVMLILPFPGTFLVWISHLSNYFGSFSFTSSLLGAGLPLFIMLYAGCAKSRYKTELRVFLLILFCRFGLFHPLAEVSFINVGQGDSILIREPFGGKTYMIDTGKPEQYAAVQAFLDGKGVHQIDTLFITHGDTDHSGNMESIQNDYDVRHLVTEHFDTWNTGRIVFHDLNTLKTEDENQSSLVHWFTVDGISFMCMGDADQLTEEGIVNAYGQLPCDVLKLSHHGSNTGNCAKFLDTMRPQLGIVSSGSYAIYHHPAPDVINRLAQRHIPWFDTKEEGDISIFILPGLHILVTSKGTVSLL